MSQTTTNIGRLGLPDPDLGFDTLDGGTALHARLRANFGMLSDHLMWRYFSTTLANGATLAVPHNFNLALTKLRYLVFESGNQRTAAQVTADYTIAEVDANNITVQNTSGGSKTFLFCLFAGKYGIQSADLDPALTIDVTGNVTAALLSATGNDIVLNSDATSAGADWKATIRRPSSGMAADAILTLPATTDTLVGRDVTETLSNKTLTAVGGITLVASAALNWAAGNVALGAGIGANTLTIGGASTSTVVTGNFTSGTLRTNSDDLVLNNDAAGSSGDFTLTLRRPAAGMVANSVLTLPGATDTLVGRVTIDTLTNKTLSYAKVSGALDFAHTTTPANAGSGFLRLYAKNDDKLYTINQAGVEVVVGSGSGSGGINYITEGDFESTANGATPAGWTAYLDSGATPTDGTGGSPNAAVTFAASNSSPIRGLMSAVFTKDANNRQGTGWSKAFTISGPDTGKKSELYVELDASANYVQGDLVIYAFDITNGTLIAPASAAVPKLTNGSTRFQFDLTSGLSYRLILHIATTSALAWTVKFDTFVMNANTAGQGFADRSPGAAGTVEPFAGSSAPTGYLLCDGTAYNQADYPDLFTAIGSTYNTQTNPTTGLAYSAPSAGTFRVPDYRGIFHRMVGTASGGTAVTLGGYQAQTTARNGLAINTISGTMSGSTGSMSANAAHSHTPPANGFLTGTGTAAGAGGGAVGGVAGSTANVSGTAATNTDHTHPAGSLAWTYSSGSLTTGDTETRPYNKGVNYIIRAWNATSNLFVGPGAQPIYASNSSVTTATDSSSFQYGEAGAAIQSFAPSGASSVSKRVRCPFPNPKIAFLQINVAGRNWVTVGDLGFTKTANDAGTTNYGVELAPVGGSATDFDVAFYSGAIAGAAWSVLSGAGFRWRVVFADSPTAVGFGLATATESGLVSNESSGSFVAAYNGPFVSTNFTIEWVKVGKQVTLNMPVVSVTATTTQIIQISLANMPAAIRPAITKDFITRNISNSLDVVGFTRIPAAGDGFLYSSAAAGTFPSGGVAGQSATSVTYRSP